MFFFLYMFSTTSSVPTTMQITTRNTAPLTNKHIGASVVTTRLPEFVVEHVAVLPQPIKLTELLPAARDPVSVQILEKAIIMERMLELLSTLPICADMKLYRDDYTQSQTFIFRVFLELDGRALMSHVEGIITPDYKLCVTGSISAFDDDDVVDSIDLEFNVDKIPGWISDKVQNFLSIPILEASV